MTCGYIQVRNKIDMLPSYGVCEHYYYKPILDSNIVKLSKFTLSLMNQCTYQQGERSISPDEDTLSTDKLVKLVEPVKIRSFLRFLNTPVSIKVGNT